MSWWLPRVTSRRAARQWMAEVGRRSVVNLFQRYRISGVDTCRDSRYRPTCHSRVWLGDARQRESTMTLAQRIAAQSALEGWERVPGATAAWSRSDGATIHADTYSPTWTATRRRSIGSGTVEAGHFYTLEAALAWVGPMRDRFPFAAAITV